MVAQPIEQPLDVLARLDDLAAGLAEISLASYATLTPGQARVAAARVRSLQSRLAAHVGAAVRVVERLVAARDTRQLLAGDFGLDAGLAHRQLRDAQVMDGAGQAEEAAATGVISHVHATIIGKALGELPEEVSREQKDRAERALIQDAQRLSPKDLTARARRVLDLFAEPECVDEHENALLERQEAAAWQKTSFSMWDNRDGTWSGKFVLPQLQALMLKAVVDAHAAPRRAHLAGSSRPGVRPDARSPGTGNSTDRQETVFDPPVAGLTRVQQARIEAETQQPYDRLAGRALATLVEHLPVDGLPTTGGTPARIMVTISEDRLRSDVAAAGLATGERISAGALRRLACNHGILPAVLDGASVPVNLGRSKRLFQVHQRDALAVLDGGCVTPGCDRPPAWCEAHHGDPWSRNGRTDLKNGYLLCASHHHEAHLRQWRMQRAPDGRAEINRGNGYERNYRYRP